MRKWTPYFPPPPRRGVAPCLASDAETRMLQSTLHTDEWLPIWFYGNALRLDDWDEVATVAPSWHVGQFWSQGRFGLGHFSMNGGPERALIFPTNRDSRRYVLGDLYFACFDVWFETVFNAVHSGQGEVTGVRLHGWPTAVWAFVGKPRANDSSRWRHVEHGDRRGVSFVPDESGRPQVRRSILK